MCRWSARKPETVVIVFVTLALQDCAEPVNFTLRSVVCQELFLSFMGEYSTVGVHHIQGVGFPVKCVWVSYDDEQQTLVVYEAPQLSQGV